MSDVFIFLDTVDFQKNGLQNRNKVLTSNGPIWLTVPVQQKLGQKIIDTKISSSSQWRDKHIKTLTMSYGKLDYFKNNHSRLFPIYMKDTNSLAELNISLTKELLSLMNISTSTYRSSQMISSGSSSELLFGLCKEVGATTYISGIGGHQYLDVNLFESNGIAVEFLPPKLPKPYPHTRFKSGSYTDLSVVDLLFNCGESWPDYL